MLRSIVFGFLYGVAWAFEWSDRVIVTTKINEQIVFVYGTLKRGGQFHHHLEGLKAEFLGTATVRGSLYDLGRFPGLYLYGFSMNSPALPLTKGEVFKILGTEAALTILDEVEGFDPTNQERSFFRRVRREVQIKDAPLLAWLYVLNDRPKDETKIPSGEWTNV